MDISKKRCESLNLNREKRYNNRTGLDWIRTQEKIIRLDWTGLKKYLDRTWTQFLESKKLWTGFGFGKVQSTYTPSCCCSVVVVSIVLSLLLPSKNNNGDLKFAKKKKKFPDLKLRKKMMSKWQSLLIWVKMCSFS